MGFLRKLMGKLFGGGSSGPTGPTPEQEAEKARKAAEAQAKSTQDAADAQKKVLQDIQDTAARNNASLAQSNQLLTSSSVNQISNVISGGSAFAADALKKKQPISGIAASLGINV